MAGHAYRSTRNELNWIPFPQEWTPFFPVPDPTTAAEFPAKSGFEAVAFQRDTEIVISYAGTDSSSFADLAADSALAAGNWSDQLLQAAEYYLQIKAANTTATITLTGHSLGGGLAALIAVFFGERATTFDQAPFAFSALDFGNNNAADLRARLAAKLDTNGVRLYDDEALSGLSAYLELRSASTISSYIPRSDLVNTIRVEGEFLEHGVLGASSIGNNSATLDHGPGGSGFDLHSQALLAAFLQSSQSAPSIANQKQSLSEATKKLIDALPMFFNTNLFATDPKSAEPNFLDRLVRHEAGVKDSFDADAMVTRFTSDLWKLAKDGGLTMTDGNPTNAQLNQVSKTLVAFAMQMYYEDTANATNRNKQLFTEVTGGIRFDMADVSSKFAVAFQNGDKLNLADAKGFDLYFKSYLQQVNSFTPEDGRLIQSTLPYMRDWYVQAGASGLATTDTLNRGAFMMGGIGSDSLVGGSAADLLVGNAGDDRLDGTAGIDTLLGGLGADTLIGGEGHDLLLGGADNDTYQFTGNTGLDIIRDRDGQIVVGAAPISGGSKLADSVWTDDKQFAYALIEGSLVIRPSAASGVSGIITVKDWTNGQLGITLSDTAAPLPATTTSYIGDFAKKTNPEGTQYVLGEDGQYVADGAQANALDLITGTGGADLIQGLGGDDALLGAGGDDIIEGGEGNDVLMGGLAADVLKGGAGRDLIYGSSTGSLQYPLTNYPVLEAFYPIVLGEGFNWKHTSPGLDDDGFQQGFLSNNVGRDTQANDAGNTIDGGSGDDVIYAGTGNDVVHGGQDMDQITGMAGADVLFGDEGDDRIYGDGSASDTGVLTYTPADQHGNDILVGGTGDDLLIGQGASDALYGGLGSDWLYGDDRDNTSLSGDDYLDGGDDNDALLGGAGDDILIGGSGNDTLKGGAGRDVYVFNRGDGQDTVLDDGEKNNVFRFGAGVNRSDVTLRLGSLMLDLGNGDQIHIEGFNQADATNSVAISSFEFADGSVLSTDELLGLGFDIDGNQGDDFLQGTSVDDRIYGLDGNDTLVGGAGNDLLVGGTGNDTLHAVTGNNVLQGDDGDDVLVAGDGEDTLVGGSGRNTFFLHEHGSRTVVQASGEEDTIVVAAGLKLTDVVSGSVDAESLTLTLENGQQLVVHGQATYRFANGVYTQTQVAAFVGALGSGSVAGTDGNDILHGGATDDYLFAAGGNDVVVGGAGDDRLFGQGGDDMVAGGRGADSVAGGDGHDILYGYDGSDKLWGQAGDDSLYGEGGADELSGGEGNDLLVGGVGDDVLIAGGSGTKTYLFNVGDGSDVILPAAGTRRLKFGAGIASGDIKLYNSPSGVARNYVRVQYSSQDSVLVQLGSGNGALEYEFADGTVMTHAALAGLATQPVPAAYSIIGTESADNLWAGNRPTELIGAGGNDALEGSSFSDVLRGGSGDDTIFAGAGDDLLVGGGGKDSLEGGWGSDTYVYARGDGNDVIGEASGIGDVNVLRFADLSAADVIYSRESNGSLLIRIKDSTGSVEIGNWYTNPNQRLQRIIYADGSSPDLTVLANLSQASVQGSSGADQLAGSQYADVVEGLAGDDTIDGAAGNDVLVGGEGVDTYLMRRRMGIDTIYESSGATSFLKLGASLGFEDLLEERQGEDLYLHFSASADGVVLQDYFSAGITWIVMLDSGERKALGDVIAENHARAAADTTQQLREEWLAGAKTSLIEMYLYDERRYQPEQIGPYELRINYPNYTVTRGFSESVQTSDAIYVERSSWLTDSTAGSWTTTYNAQLPTDRFQGSGGGSGNPYFEIYDWGNLDAMGQPTHTVLGLMDGEFLTPAQLPRDGIVIAPSSTPARVGYITVPVKVAASENHLDVFEDIVAGPSSNFIYTFGLGLVDAGAGDDVIYVDSGNGMAWDYPGQFLDGGAGNDILIGGYSDDALVAGAGDDYLVGGMGHDKYYIGANDTGTKIVDEVTDVIRVSDFQGGYWISDKGALYSRDTVRFGPGIDLSNISIERGTYTSPYAVRYSGGWVADSTVFETLDISWGNGATARVLLPTVAQETPDNDGLGIEFFEFADGTRLTTGELLELVEGHGANTSPVVSQPITDQSSVEDFAWSFTVPVGTFADVDVGDTLTYSASLGGGSDLPAWLQFDALTGTFSGTPGNAEVGTLVVQVTATDSAGAAVCASFDLAVTNTNDAPTLTQPISNMTTAEDAPWTFEVPAGTFADVDAADTLTYSAALSNGAALPSWLSFDAATRTFSGTPENADVGTVTLQVTATDSAGAAACASFDLAVTNTNDAPTLAQVISNMTTAEDAPWTFEVPAGTFADIDAADTLTYSAALSNGAALPSWLSFDAATRTFSGTPGNDDVGMASVSVTATDAAGAFVTETFIVVVTNTNDAPVVSEVLLHQKISAGSAWSYVLPEGAFTDPDIGDTLTYVVALADGAALPAWLSYDANTRTLAGTPPNAGPGDLAIRVVAQDSSGSTAEQTLALRINLVLTGTKAADTLVSGSGDDHLDGLTGADIMTGGGGDDIYVVDNAGDVVTEDVNEGLDLVRSSVTYTLGANFENLVLTRSAAINGYGNAVNNWVQGNAAPNTLDGGAGADSLLGGAGNDTYVVDDLGDWVIEDAGDGIDTVYASVSYWLTQNTENLVLTGTAGISGYGNTQANRMQGNAGDNTLDGGLGADTMLGRAGHDTYVVDNAADMVTEKAGEGIDTVYSSVDYALQPNVENLVLTGTATVGIGNAQANWMRGNDGNNVLLGGAGNDTLSGMGGSDTLDGGPGDDTYWFDRGSGSDLLVERGTSFGDVGQFGSDIATEQLWFTQSGENRENLVVQVIGTSDYLTVWNWYTTSGAHPVDCFRTSDGSALQESRVQNLVDAMASFAPPPPGQTTLSPEYESALGPTIAANWQ